MTANEVVAELQALGRESIKKVLRNHGVKEPFFGVRIGDMKSLRQRLKKDYQLALDLYATGNYDAMYLAGLIADDARMTRKDLQRWVDRASCAPACGFTVAWVAAGSPHGWDLALKWIDSEKPLEAVAGWATLSSVVSIKVDAELDLPLLKQLLQRVQRTIHRSPDAVRYQMNAFVIAVGAYVQPLSVSAMETGEKIGPVSADLGANACQAPFAPDYIRKVEQRGSIGKKRKTAKC